MLKPSHDRIPYWLIYVVIVAIFFAASFLIPHDRSIPITNTIKDAPTVVFDILKEMISFIISLNTIMIAAAAALTVKGKDWTEAWDRIDSYLIILSFVSGALSYLGIYIEYGRILTMVDQATIDPFEGGLTWAIGLQYYGTIFGVALIGLVFVRMLEGRKAHKTKTP